MPRPRKRRRLRHKPRPAFFKPVGHSLGSLEQVTLLFEELEALRLADLEGHHQAEAARQMSISRSTFQRLIREARRKVALALVNGLALQIQGGDFRVADVHRRCLDCGHSWSFPHGSGRGQFCPACGSEAVQDL